jgi:Domain of unknown function (DUF4249)
MRSTSEPMKPPHRWLLLLLPLSAMLMACERVVSISAPTSPPRLVVEARLERERGAPSGDQVIRLSSTQDVFSSVAPSAVRGATVRVVDDSARVTVFTESASEPGAYRAAAMALPVGRSLTLEIGWQGDQYRATEVVKAAVGMDSIFFRPQFSKTNPGTSLRATIAAKDPGGSKNFYVWDQWIDDRRLVAPDSEFLSRVVVSDELFNGGTVRNFQPYDGWTVAPGQLVRIRQLSISEQAYRFYQMLSMQVSNDGSPFGVPASSVRGNVANITTPSKLAVGYFIAGEYTELQRRVP